MIHYVVIEIKVSKSPRKTYSLSNDISQNPIHIILTGSYAHLNEEFIEKHIKQAMIRFEYKSAMVSLIGMWKENCITKEKIDIEYGLLNEKTVTELKNIEGRDDYSVGEDLETIYTRIKNGEISNKTIQKDKELKITYLFCLLDRDDRRKLNMKDPDFFRSFNFGNFADIPEKEWQKTEYKQLKFTKSWAVRRTDIIEVKSEDELLNQECPK